MVPSRSTGLFRLPPRRPGLERTVDGCRLSHLASLAESRGAEVPMEELTLCLGVGVEEPLRALLPLCPELTTLNLYTANGDPLRLLLQMPPPALQGLVELTTGP